MDIYKKILVIIIIVNILLYICIFLYLYKNHKDQNNSYILQCAKNPNSKICIVMSHTENIYSYSKLAEYINRIYACKHGYDFKIFNLTMKDRAPQWCKIEAINVLLNDEQSNYDYLFWIDADAFFNNHNIPLETFITDSNKNIIICDDSPNSSKPNSINTGTFFVKCSEWSRNFFNKIWNYNGEHLYKPLHEQTVIDMTILYDFMNMKENILIYPTDVFNSIYHKLSNENYKRDNFILHVMAHSSDTRRKYMNDWLLQNGHTVSI